MSLIQTIKEHQLQARKERDVPRASLLTTLLGESMMVGKSNGNRETTDAEVMVVVRKFINNIDFFIEASKGETPPYLKLERQILEQYLPTQMTGDALRATILEIIKDTAAENMGTVMKTLKERHSGHYDGNEASKLVREVLG